MANYCFFMMQVAGKQKEAFVERLNQGFGRIYGISCPYTWSSTNNENVIEIDGNCAWSFHTAMLDYGIADLTEEYDVELEVYTSEPGLAFQEHYFINRGDIIENECLDYIEIYLDCLTDEELQAEIENQGMTKDEFMSHVVDDDHFQLGGFPDWNFPHMEKYKINPIDVNIRELSNLLEV